MTTTIPRTADAPAATDVTAPAAVSIESVSKTFRLPHQQYSTLKERVLHPFRSTEYDELRAVRNVSLQIANGEFFGIVGRNGSGKSTLLKCIAGIYGVDTGRISIAGRLSPFIELGVGFNMDLTARDNVIINAIMLGLSRKEARARFDEVIAFAELEEFIDLKLKNYSSGMMVRLAFATSIQVQAEILLIDEVLAVGDAAFQQKCFEEFYRLKREGRTIVFVSHDMFSVERFCDRAMLMERGEMVQLETPARSGAPTRSSTSATSRTRLPRRSRRAAARPSPRHGSRTRPASASPAPARTRACHVLRGSNRRGPQRPRVRGHPAHRLGHTIVVARSDQHARGTGSFRAGETATARFELPNWLTPSRYTLTPSIAREGTGEAALALVEDMSSIVISGNVSGGILELPIDVRIERS